MKTGTGFTGQYFSPNRERYESLETCPDELLLFFHYVPYTHRLKTGETVIQHIYNTHFEGVERVEDFIRRWIRLKGKIDAERYELVQSKLHKQLENAREWRDVINAYFSENREFPMKRAVRFTDILCWTSEEWKSANGFSLVRDWGTTRSPWSRSVKFPVSKELFGRFTGFRPVRSGRWMRSKR